MVVVVEFRSAHGRGAVKCRVELRPDGTARALALLPARPGAFQADYREHEWKPGVQPVRMIRKEEGFCYLSGVAGKFEGDGESVRVHVAEDGWWYLSGKAAQDISARAISVRVKGR